MNFEDQPWRVRGACRGLDPTLWTRDGTPPQGRASTRKETDEELIAKHICWTLCPVRAICEEAGKGHPGIWGGLDEWERSGGTRRRRDPQSWPAPPGLNEALIEHTKYVHDLRKAQEAVGA